MEIKLTLQLGLTNQTYQGKQQKQMAMKHLALVFLSILTLSLTVNSQPVNRAEAVHLPSKLHGNRFYLQIPTPGGDTISAFCDTGGGYTAIYPQTLKRLNLEHKVSEVKIKGRITRFIPALEVIGLSQIPVPQIAPYYTGHISIPFFEIPAADKESDLVQKYIPHDAFLGQYFFINQAWTFDYASGKVLVNTPVAPDKTNPNIQQLGFKKDRKGVKTHGHPSMKVEVDGQTIDMLFDTGASILLNETGRKQLGTNANSLGGSFIAKSLFDAWRLKHPEWRVIEKGELAGYDLIEVPQVKVGNLTAGPVWFAKRPDEAWSKGMITSMDKVVKGAIGGSFLQYFRVTVDYNNELIYFEKAD